VTARARDLIAEHPGIRKMLEQRDDIRKGFMKGEDVAIHRVVKMGMNTIKKRMSSFVGDYVMRQASEDNRTGGIIGVFDINGKIAEKQGLLFRAIESIAIT